MQTALIIPVWNDLAGVERLLQQARRLACFSEVIIVDDASDPPLDEARLREIWGAHSGPLLLLRQETQQGAGAARNRALEHVTASHLLFFDADDLLTPEIPPLLGDLAGRDFDFCLFRHHDSRVGRWGRYGQMAADDAHWRDAGVAVGALCEVDASQARRLVGISNYPWNKIYRTDFLRAHDIRCSETPVHNDIALHWLSFLHARRILTSDRVGARHFVAAQSNRLTNRSGRERLTVFDTLGAVAAHLDEDDKEPPRLPDFLRFSCYLFDWIEGFLDSALRGEFHAATRDFLLAFAPRPVFAQLARTDPVLARKITLQLARGRS